MSDDDTNEERAVEYTDAEKRAIRFGSALARIGQSDELRKLGHQASRRGQQRAVALLVGLASDRSYSMGYIYASRLRDILRTLNIYNQANFTQDMRKDSTDPVRGRGEDGLWREDTYHGGRGSGRGLAGHWVLTEKGKKLAECYALIVDRGVEATQRSVTRSFIIKAKAISCPFCREKVTPEDRAVCSGKCGSEAHATCLAEFGRACGSCNHGGRNIEGRPDCASCGGTGRDNETTCALARTTVRCAGHYKVASVEA